MSSTLAVAPASVRSGVPVWIVWAVRVTCVLHLLGVLAQAVLAGLFVTGDVDLLKAHEMNAHVTTGLLVLQLVAVVVLWRRGRGKVWPVWASVALLVLLEAQVGLGYARDLVGHFPLGMMVFGGAAAMTAWAWLGRMERGGAGASHG
ncbi:hypothetical protein HNP84_000367 [Thermocatellispora tengchongensis]|uniref:Uncharacterized protein n=1 Tax=Thermocatellispora tengchongensis TaxID=1073253 RepID=A0A840NV45_9ACTN|nr:hypothetical protein [Thermocatellispora tengchongensis]MBB5130679.1 hypothetical protein [Thermocatellispora tengchongensis]